MDHALAALSELFEPMRLVALFTGMMAGMVFGMMPGLGGVAAVSIMLPFIFLFDALGGLALLLGTISVVYTSDTITSVLLGAPGSPASAPTAIEGHAMAKRGEASTALGVGFLSSMLGGLGGAVTLALAIPIAGPIVLALGTPELLMFALVGLYFASSMVGKDLAVGVLAGCFGLLLGTIGPAPAAANFRFTFGQAYLLDGLSLTIVALGLFAIAEVIGMLAGGGGISSGRQVVSNWSTGFSTFWKHKWLALRGAIIGTFGGFVPAVGANASTWVAYGDAMRSAKDKSRFGKGEPRGIAAAEGANNATVISDLVPTLLFSVPGGPAAAIFLGALFSFGFYPGPRMVSEQPTLLYLIIVPLLWKLAMTRRRKLAEAAAAVGVEPLLAAEEDEPRGTTTSRLVLAVLAVAVFAYAAFETSGFRANARLLPLLAIVPGLALSLFVLAREVRSFLTQRDAFNFDAWEEYPVAGMLLLYGVGIALVGLNLATLAFLMFVLVQFARMRMITAIIYTAVLIAGVNGMFMLMRLTPPAGYLTSVNVF